MYLAAHLVWFSKVHRNSVFVLEASSLGVWAYWIIREYYRGMNNTTFLPLLAPQITSPELLFLICHVSFLMSHVILHTLWQGRGVSFCWNVLQPDTETMHKITLLKKITWLIGLKYWRVTMKGTDCSHCKPAQNPTTHVCFHCGLIKDWKEMPGFPFLTPSSNILLYFKTIYHFPLPKCK